MILLHTYSDTYSQYFPNIYYNGNRYYIHLKKGKWSKVAKSWNKANLVYLKQVTKEVT